MPRKKARRRAFEALPAHLGMTQSPFPRMVFAISLGVVWINRSCKPANPAFTMSEIWDQASGIRRYPTRSKLFSISVDDALAQPKLRPLGHGEAWLATP
jgi:hypothetical protein